MFVQPFVAYTFPSFTTIGINTESTYNWENHQTTIPINLTAAQILKIVGQLISLQIGPRYYAKNVPGGAECSLPFTFTIFLPKHRSGSGPGVVDNLSSQLRSLQFTAA